MECSCAPGWHAKRDITSRYSLIEGTLRLADGDQGAKEVAFSTIAGSKDLAVCEVHKNWGNERFSSRWTKGQRGLSRLGWMSCSVTESLGQPVEAAQASVLARLETTKNYPRNVVEDALPVQMVIELSCGAFNKRKMQLEELQTMDDDTFNSAFIQYLTEVDRHFQKVCLGSKFAYDTSGEWSFYLCLSMPINRDLPFSALRAKCRSNPVLWCLAEAAMQYCTVIAQIINCSPYSSELLNKPQFSFCRSGSANAQRKRLIWQTS